MEDGSQTWPKLQCLRQLWEEIQPHIAITFEGSTSLNPCRYKFAKSEFEIPLVGKIQVDTETGFHQLIDNTCKINLVFISKLQIPQGLLFFEKLFTIVQQLEIVENASYRPLYKLQSVG